MGKRRYRFLLPLIDFVFKRNHSYHVNRGTRIEKESWKDEEVPGGSEHPYRSLFENSLNGVLLTTPDGAILEANPEACRLLGRTEEEICREGRAGVMVQDEKLAAWLNERTRTGAWRGEINLRRNDGTVFPAEASSGAFVSTNETTMIVLSFVDISERKRTEYELRRTREDLERRVKEKTLQLQRQADLLDLAYDAIIVRDMSGKITFWSLGAEKMYGWKKTEALGCVGSELLKTQASSSLSDLEQRVAKKGHWEGELRQIRKDGTAIVVSSRHVVQKDQDGRPVAFLETNSDVTEQVRLGEQLREAQKMEALANLSSGIAHDFNNILVAIMGFSELGLDKTATDSPVHRYLSHIFNAATRGSDLVRRILAFTRSGEQQKRPLSLSSVVKESLRLLRASLLTTIEIRARLDDASDVIMGDGTQLQQIVMNLSTNAAYAMKEKGGVLEVVLGNVSAPSPGTPPSLIRGDYVTLTVRDTGTGMSDHVREHIFEPFFTTKERAEGTGLGLAIVHGIVKAHGGEITVSSTPGKGSVFTIYFPAVHTDEVFPEREGKSAILPGGRERVLLLDDEPPLAEMGAEMLSELGYQVQSFTSPGLAIDVFTSNPSSFDVIVTDQTMPGMTGIELAKRIHGIRGDIPIILLSGHADVAGNQSLQAAGIKVSLNKPFVKADIGKAVRDVLDARNSQAQRTTEGPIKQG